MGKSPLCNRGSIRCELNIDFDFISFAITILTPDEVRNSKKPTDNLNHLIDRTNSRGKKTNRDVSN